MSTETKPQQGAERPAWQRSRWLPVGDLAVFAVFTLIGLGSHGDSYTPYHFLRNFVPLSVSWFLVVLIVDPYDRPGWWRLGVTWLVAMPVAVAVRVWWVGSPNGPKLWTFLGVVLITNGLFLLLWRLIASRLLGRRERREGRGAVSA